MFSFCVCFFLCPILHQEPSSLGMNTKQAVQEIGKHANILPRERGVTLPLIEIEQGRVIMRRLYYYTRTVPKDGMHITPPQFVGVADMTNGKFIALTQFEDDLKPSMLAPTPWKHERFRFESSDEILVEFDAIYRLYDRLLPGFIDRDAPISNELAVDAKRYLELFEKHAEKPLLPYYERFGGNFLAWVRKIAQKK